MNYKKTRLNSIQEGVSVSSNQEPEVEIKEALRHHDEGKEEYEDVFKILDEERLQKWNFESLNDEDFDRAVQEELEGKDRVLDHQNADSDEPTCIGDIEESLSLPDEDDEDDAPIIYASNDFDEDMSQITSSIAGNTMYSNDHLLSTISFPQNFPRAGNYSVFSNYFTGTNVAPGLESTGNSGSSLFTLYEYF